jgi:hypothetical protein
VTILKSILKDEGESESCTLERDEQNYSLSFSFISSTNFFHFGNISIFSILYSIEILPGPVRRRLIATDINNRSNSKPPTKLAIAYHFETR